MNKPPPSVRALRAVALVVAVLFALGVVLGVGELFFFGSSEVRPLFGMSADALQLQDGVTRRPDGGPRRFSDFADGGF